MKIRRANQTTWGAVATTSAASTPVRVDRSARPMRKAASTMPSAPRAMPTRSTTTDVPNSRYSPATIQ